MSKQLQKSYEVGHTASIIIGIALGCLLPSIILDLRIELNVVFIAIPFLIIGIMVFGIFRKRINILEKIIKEIE